MQMKNRGALSLPTNVIQVFALALLALSLVGLNGCHRFHSSPQYVYVSCEHTFLRDRVAPVANFVTEVTNGQHLLVLEHQTRFYHVRAPNGKVGWIEEYYIINQAEMDKFDALRRKYTHTEPVATALLQEVSYLHDAPGREAPHYYLLPVNDKLDLIKRASVIRPLSYFALMRERQAALASKSKTLPPPPREDYWLVRDSEGRTGWVRSSALSPDVPNSVVVLGGSSRMIAGYLLHEVTDSTVNTPDHKVGEYLTVLSPYEEGLPYNFDQVRVFTWDSYYHHYELAFRARDIQGFFPIHTGTTVVRGHVLPTFCFRVSLNPKITLDPKTDEINPGPLETVCYQMQGAIVRQVSGPQHYAVLAKPSKLSGR